MPPRTRATVSADRIYSSSALQRQLVFKPRKQRITARHSLGSAALSRQQTLTQIDYVNIHRPFDIEENVDVYLDDTPRRRSKRRKTDGYVSSSSKNIHTQTLTQYDFVSTPVSRFDDVDDGTEPVDSMVSARAVDAEEWKDFHDHAKVTQQTIQDMKAAQAVISMHPPRTPNRSRLVEIPSSQSPITPLSSKSEYRSPLKEVIPNVQSDYRALELSWQTSSPTKPIKLEMTGGNDENERSQQMTPAALKWKPNSTKGVRFACNTQTNSPERMVGSKDIPRRIQRTPRMVVIEDSEAESEEEPDTCYDDLGHETQIEAETLASSSAQEELESTCKTEEEEHSPLGVSQYVETQRLSTQDFDLMAPRSDKSDIIISIHPQHVANILNRTKDHEFRNWPIPDQVSRIWIYETKPTSAIKYMASIGPVKLRGEIANENGLGNADFNKGEKTSSYAYEILQVYDLADPVSLATAKANAWLGGPPQKYVYVRPAVLDHLMANLKAPMFPESQPFLESSFGIDSQEAEAQLRSTILQYTQLSPNQRTSSPIGSSDTKFNQALDLLSTQQDSYRDTASNFQLRPSQATTVDYTQREELETERNEHMDDNDEQTVDDNETLIPDSPIVQVSSSLHSLPALPAMHPAQSSQETLVPFSLSSSQLMTKSQLLSQSLLDNSVAPPPLCIEDSDEEV